MGNLFKKMRPHVEKALAAHRAQQTEQTASGPPKSYGGFLSPFQRFGSNPKKMKSSRFFGKAFRNARGDSILSKKQTLG